MHVFLSTYTVDAEVRSTSGEFEKKGFRFQLGAFDEPYQREAEARRIIRQIGYAEFRNVNVRDNK